MEQQAGGRSTSSYAAGTGGAEAGVEVFVVTEKGELADGYPSVGAMDCVQKTSQQVKPSEQASAQAWAEPRVSMEDLLYFFDVNVWHRRSVLVKALLVGGLGFRVEKEGPDGRSSEVIYDGARGVNQEPENPVVRLVSRPNAAALETFDEMVFRLMVDYYATGNAYLEVARDRTGKPSELYHVPARTMRRDAKLGGYWQVKRGQRRSFAGYGAASDGSPSAEKNEILHLYQYDPASDYYGMPDWYGAIAAMGLDRVVLEFNTGIFRNGLMAHTAVVVEGGRLSESGREALKSFVRDRATGAANAGRVLLLEDDRQTVRIRFEKLNLDVKDLLIVEAQKHFRDMVITAHGVPPRLLGIIQAGQLGATGEVEGQLRTFRETVLRPGRQQLESALNVLMAELEPTTRVRFSEMDVTDLKADADFFDRMLQHKVYTPEDVRQMLDAAGR